MLSRHRGLLLSAGAVVLVGLVACGDDAGSSTSSSSSSTSSGGSDGGSTSSSSSSSSSSSGGDAGKDASVETPGVTVSAPSKTQTTEDGDKVTFTVVLKSKPTADVTIAVTSDKVAEGTVDKATLTFTAANYNTPQTVTVTGIDDEVDDGDIDYKINMAVTTTDTGYKALTVAPIALKNMDNDTAGLMVGTPSGTKTTEKGGKITFTVRLRSKPSADVTVPVLSDKVAEGTADKATLTFTAADYKTEQTVTVTGVDEILPDGDVAYNVKLGKTTSADTLYKDLEAQVALMNVDDDMPVQIVGSWGSHCVRFVDGSVKCWGRNDSGMLGLGDTNHRGDQPNEMGSNLPFVNLGTGRTAKLLAYSMRAEAHHCAITDENKLKCWGGGFWGQLGNENTTNLGDQPNEMGDNLPYVNLGAGRTVKWAGTDYGVTCAILDNDKMKCWGLNDNGNLGYGDTVRRGDNPNEMGDNLPYIDLGANRTVKSAAVGHFAVCAILDNDKVKCWGRNGSGTSGYGDTNQRGDQPNEMGDNLPYVDLGNGRTAKSITGGLEFFCAILDNDALKCWGNGSWGNLGMGNSASIGFAANQMGDNLLPINLGTNRKATAVYGGWASVCAILDDKGFKCWGYNGEGESGYGDTNQRGDAPNEMGDNLLNVDLGTGRTAVQSITGTHSKCAILDNGTVKCWGNNGWGQSGYGDTNARGNNPNEMGNNLPAVQLK